MYLGEWFHIYNNIYTKCGFNEFGLVFCVANFQRGAWHCPIVRKRPVEDPPWSGGSVDRSVVHGLVRPNRVAGFVRRETLRNWHVFPKGRLLTNIEMALFASQHDSKSEGFECFDSRHTGNAEIKRCHLLATQNPGCKLQIKLLVGVHDWIHLRHSRMI